MQKIVLFIEPTDDAWSTPLKSGNLFMNRFAVDEDAASEVLKIFELEKTSDEMSYQSHPNYKNFIEERNEKGKDLFNLSYPREANPTKGTSRKLKMSSKEIFHMKEYVCNFEMISARNIDRVSKFLDGSLF